MARGLVFAVLSVVALGQSAQAEEARVVSHSACPTREDLVRQLEPLLPGWIFPQVGAGSATGHQVIVTELGQGLVVTVDDQARRIDDSRANCTERAKVAAVFAAMVLAPPDFGADPLSRPKKPEKIGPPETGSTATSPSRLALAEEATWLLRLGIGITMSAGASPTSSTNSGGTIIGLVQRANVGLSIGVSAGSTHGVDYPGASVRVLRLPWEFMPYAVWNAEGVELLVRAGLVAEWARFQGQGAESSRGGQRLNLGAGAGLYALINFGAMWFAWVGVSGSYFPRTYDFVIEPSMLVGSAPNLWVTATLGLGLALF